MINQAINQIKHDQDNLIFEWINSEKILPQFEYEDESEYSGACLVKVASGFIFPAVYCYDSCGGYRFWWETFDVFNSSLEEREIEDKVTHWQYLDESKRISTNGWIDINFAIPNQSQTIFIAMKDYWYSDIRCDVFDWKKNCSNEDLPIETKYWMPTPMVCKK